SYFATGIKGRPGEASYEDHLALEGVQEIVVPDGEHGTKSDAVPLRNAMNEVTRGAYVRDCEIGLKRWNRTIAKAGAPFELTLPSTRFRRGIGAWAGRTVDPTGKPVSPAEWERRREEWLPNESDRTFVKSLMLKVVEPGKMAAWIAPPERGINNLPVEY